MSLDVIGVGPTFTFGRRGCPRCDREQYSMDPERLYCPFCLKVVSVAFVEEMEVGDDD